jgi:hypothetical protein
MASRVAPPKGSLHDAVQSGEAGVARNEQSTPDRRLDAGQQDLKLTDLVGRSYHRLIAGPRAVFQATLNRQPLIFPGLQVPALRCVLQTRYAGLSSLCTIN